MGLWEERSRVQIMAVATGISCELQASLMLFHSGPHTELLHQVSEHTCFAVGWLHFMWGQLQLQRNSIDLVELGLASLHTSTTTVSKDTVQE